MATSAGAPFFVGKVFQMRTRSLLESTTTRRVPSLQTSVGKNSVLALGLPPAFARQCVKSTCPSTRSAAVPLVVGIEFQMRMRLLLLSATRSLPFTTKMLSGAARSLSAQPVTGVMKSYQPSATSAAAPGSVGMLLKTTTRLFPGELTSSLPDAAADVEGSIHCAALLPAVEVVKSGCPRTRSAEAPSVVGTEL